MSTLHQMLQPMPQVPNHLHFVVRQDRFGRWVAVEDNDLAGGLFSSEEAALRYCAAESNHAPGAVDVMPRAQGDTRPKLLIVRD